MKIVWLLKPCTLFWVFSRTKVYVNSSTAQISTFLSDNSTGRQLNKEWRNLGGIVWCLVVAFYWVRHWSCCTYLGTAEKLTKGSKIFFQKIYVFSHFQICSKNVSVILFFLSSTYIFIICCLSGCIHFRDNFWFIPQTLHIFVSLLSDKGLC
jgi:hypothetical protein